MPLLGPDGAPIATNNGIPFLQHHPDGKVEGRYIRRPSEIEGTATMFLARGGRYRVALLADGMATVAATVDAQDGSPPCIVADEMVPNGPLLLGAIDRVVTRSMEEADRVDG